MARISEEHQYRLPKRLFRITCTICLLFRDISIDINEIYLFRFATRISQFLRYNLVSFFFFPTKMRNQTLISSSDARFFYYKVDDRGVRRYYSRISGKQIAKSKIDKLYLNDIREEDDKIHEMRRWGGIWYADDETGIVSPLMPASYDEATWIHTYHPHIFKGFNATSFDSIKESTYSFQSIEQSNMHGSLGYLFISCDGKHPYHYDGRQVRVDITRNNLKQYGLQKHLSGG